VLSAHDCSDGGLAITLAESCFSSLGRDAIGADVELKGELGPTALMFSESPSRIVISFDAADANKVQEIAERNNAPFAIIGRVGGTRLMINVNGDEAVAMGVSELESTWRNALSEKLQGEVAADLHG
jgi:phosphoribosylformylglycinamidine synthase